MTLRRVGNAKFVGMMFHTVRGRASRLRRARCAGRGADDRARRPPVQVARGNQEGDRRRGLGSRARRPRLRSCSSRSCRERRSHRAARDAMLATLARHRQGSRSPRPKSSACEPRRCKYFDDAINDPQRLGVAMSESIAIGDWRLFFIHRDRWRTVTAADVQRVALDYLKRSNRTVGEFIPDAKPDRAPAPPRSTSPRWSRTTRATPPPPPARCSIHARQSRGAHAALHARQRHEGRAAAEEDARRTWCNFTRPAFRRREVAFGAGEGVGITGVDAACAARKRHRARRSRTRSTSLRAKLDVQRLRSRRSASGETVRKQAADTLRLTAEMLREPVPASRARAMLKREARRRSTPRAPIRRRSRDARCAPRQSVSEGRPALRADDRGGDRGSAGVTRRRSAALSRAVLRRGNAEIAIVGDFDPEETRARC